MGKENKPTFGAYADIDLAKARKLRDAAREQLAEGWDPALKRKKARFIAKLRAGITFSAVATEYI